MTQMFRLTQPATEGRTLTPAKVHYESEDGRGSLCGQVRVFRVIDGETMRVWYRTKRPAGCATCVKRLQINVSKQLSGLNGEQLEDLLAHIDTFRSRYGAARPDSSPALNGK